MKNKQKLKRPYERKVRFDYQENEYIKKKIEASPFDNFQNFARLMLLTGEIKFTDFTHLEKLNREVNFIGKNINQLVKRLHQFGEFSEEEMAYLQSQVSSIKDLISREFERHS